MRRPVTTLSTLLFALAIGTSGMALANANTAKEACKHKLKSISQYSHFHDLAAEKVSRGNFKVTGKVRDSRDGKNHGFNCSVNHNEVTSWYVTPPTGSDHHANAKEIGAGLLAIAAIAAIAHEVDKDHADKQQAYSSGGSNPFDDMHYLKKECRQTIREHLRHDHGAIDSVEIRSANLDGRNLTGDAKVRFKDATHHKMTYTCMFDRRGEIHDGYYHYSSESTPSHDYADGYAGGPDHRRVTGVASDDVLNMRSDPSAYNNIVGALANGDKVRNLGCRREHGSRWCKIRTRGDMAAEGWVNGRYLREAN